MRAAGLAHGGWSAQHDTVGVNKKPTRRVKRCNAPAGRKMTIRIGYSSSAILDHRTMGMSNKKISPDTCPFAEAGREAVYNSSWYMRNSNSITHSTSRGLVSSLFFPISVVIIFAGFCRTGGESLT